MSLTLDGADYLVETMGRARARGWVASVACACDTEPGGWHWHEVARAKTLPGVLVLLELRRLVGTTDPGSALMASKRTGKTNGTTTGEAGGRVPITRFVRMHTACRRGTHLACPGITGRKREACLCACHTGDYRPRLRAAR